MKRCNEYQVELSAMLDGESDPATAVMLLDHVAQCASCRGFYLELRSFQSLVDDLSIANVSETTRRAVGAPARRRSRWSWVVAPPRWAWGAAAAAVVVVVGLWAASAFELLNPAPTVVEDDKVIVRPGEGADRMSEERFVEFAATILGADRKYQNEMYKMLSDMRPDESADEAPVEGTRSEGEGGESYGEVFGAIGGRPVLD